jgi:hypothetical protein
VDKWIHCWATDSQKKGKGKFGYLVLSLLLMRKNSASGIIIFFFLGKSGIIIVHNRAQLTGKLSGQTSKWARPAGCSIPEVLHFCDVG